MRSLRYGSIKIISGNSHKQLAESIASILDVKLIDAEISAFKDGETSVRINESVRDNDIFIIQPTSYPVNDNLMELLIIIDAMKRASAGRINAVIPYYGYARQDRKTRPRDPISAKLVADIIAVAGADRLITMDLHCAQIQGFFDIPVDHLVGMPIFSDYYQKKFKNMEEIVVVSPDLGSTTRARHLADAIHSTVAIVDKKRDKPNESKVMGIIGDVKGKKAILIDDIIDTGGSIIHAADAILREGALEVNVCCTHGVFSDTAFEMINDSVIKEMIVLNTIKPKDNIPDKIKYLRVDEEFAEAIRRIHSSEPVSDMFEHPDMRY